LGCGKGALGHALIQHFLDNSRDVRGRTVDGWETGVGLIEDEVEVGAGEHDRLDAVAPADCVTNLLETCLVLI
jgi:hypothetical protein